MLLETFFVEDEEYNLQLFLETAACLLTVQLDRDLSEKRPQHVPRH